MSVLLQVTDKGKGVFAAKSFSQGARVLETTGEWVPKRTIHTIQIGREQHVLPDPPVRYLNHSCDPNLGVVLNRDGLFDFVALKDIEEGDELCFDYAMTEYSLCELEQAESERIICACGASTCRGRIGHYPALPEQTKARYEGLIAPYLLEL